MYDWYQLGVYYNIEGEDCLCIDKTKKAFIFTNKVSNKVFSLSKKDFYEGRANGSIEWLYQ